MSDLLSFSAVEARQALDKGDVSATELTSAYLDAVEATSALNNYVAVTADHALDMAKASEARIKAGEAGLIEGIPVGVKDLFCTAGVASTACSRILQKVSPRPMKAPSPPICGVRAVSCLARSIVTSSRWGRPTRRAPSAQRSIRGRDQTVSTLCRADPPAARPPPSRRVRRFLRREPTPVGRSASRRPSAVLSA